MSTLQVAPSRNISRATAEIGWSGLDRDTGNQHPMVPKAKKAATFVQPKWRYYPFPPVWKVLEFEILVFLRQFPTSLSMVCYNDISMQ